MTEETLYQYLVPRDTWYEKVDWCKDNLYHGGNYDPKWFTKYPFIVFEDEQEYAWFMLRWS